MVEPQVQFKDLKMIRMIGDIHGDFESYDKIIKDLEETYPGAKSIQVGDYGIGFGNNPDISKVNKNHRFIRGNHDCLDECMLYDNFIVDGHLDRFEGGSMMFIGGAWSIDRGYRQPYKDWWPDEEVSYEKAVALINGYEYIKPTIMVTHDMPRSASMNNFRLSEERVGKNMTNQMLDEMFKIHKPKLWIHGHWHIQYKTTFNDTTFVGLGINQYGDLDLDI